MIRKRLKISESSYDYLKKYSEDKSLTMVNSLDLILEDYKILKSKSIFNRHFKAK